MLKTIRTFLKSHNLSKKCNLGTEKALFHQVLMNWSESLKQVRLILALTFRGLLTLNVSFNLNSISETLIRNMQIKPRKIKNNRK